MIVTFALALLLTAFGDEPKLKTGEDAPAFALLSSTGATVRLSDFKGKKKVVLAFFPKAFTGGCKKEMSGLQEQKKQFDDLSAQILGVSMDDLETQKKFAESLKLSFPLLSDKAGETAAAYRVKGAMWANRTTFVIDESGKITAVFEGQAAIDPLATLAACKGNLPKPEVKGPKTVDLTRDPYIE